jgi:hypothetical protein
VPRSTHPPPPDDEAADDAHTPTPDFHTSTDVLSSKLEAAVLPFKPVTDANAKEARAPEVPAKLSGLPFRPSVATIVDRAPVNARLGALPFKPSSDAPSDPPTAAPATKPSEQRWIDDDRTRPVTLMPRGATLPFGPKPTAPIVADDPSTTPDHDAPGTRGFDDPTTAKPLPKMPEMVKKPQGGMRLGGGGDKPAGALGTSALGDAEGSIDEETEFDDRPPFDPASASIDDEPDRFRHVPEPPMLGPIGSGPSEPARAASVKKPDFLGALYQKSAEVPPPAPSSPSAVAVAVPLAKRSEPGKAPPPSPSSPDAKRPDPEAFPIDRCAAINAEIAIKRAPMPEVLKKHQIEQDEWSSIDRYWLAAITKETERGKTTLLGAYDAAYVGALEKLRGPITTEEYARVVVGVERGDVAAVLAALGLPRTALMRIERVWTKRLAEDAKLAPGVSAAVEAARKN